MEGNFEENKPTENAAVEKAAEVVTEVQEESCCGGKNSKQVKNLISLVILLGGLFVGSLFVDVIQLVRGGGFSFGKMAQNDIFSSGGRTWVAYSDPIINVQVLNDDSCANCDPEKALQGLKSVFPTLLVTKVDANSEAGQKMISDLGLKTVPSFIFGKEIAKTDFFTQAASYFENKNEQYVLNTAQVGLPVGKYLQAPTVATEDTQVGSAESKVKVVLFSDYQCPFCKALHPTIKKVLEQYGDRILFVFKHLPLSIHPQAENASLAAICASEQGKFMEYSDKLFNAQAEWGKTTGVQSFKNYAAQLGLKGAQFNQCLDSKKFQSVIDRNKSEADELGISGTPGTFVNGDFQNGAVSFEDLQKLIEQELAK